MSLSLCWTSARVFNLKTLLFPLHTESSKVCKDNADSGTRIPVQSNRQRTGSPLTTIHFLFFRPIAKCVGVDFAAGLFTLPPQLYKQSVAAVLAATV